MTRLNFELDLIYIKLKAKIKRIIKYIRALIVGLPCLAQILTSGPGFFI